MKNNVLLLTFLSALLFLSSGATVSADYGQYGQYGQPSPSQTILIDKQVGKPGATMTKGGVMTIDYVDNLTPADTRFRPGEEVNFKLKVKNTSNVTLNNVTVKDVVPSYLEPIEGPGAFDEKSRTISFDAGSFAPDQEKTYFIKMQLFPQDKMPADKGLFCLTNKATAGNGSAYDDDASQFCIEKEVIGVKAAPKAGPELGIVLFSGQMIVLGAGLTLKKLSQKA